MSYRGCGKVIITKPCKQQYQGQLIISFIVKVLFTNIEQSSCFFMHTWNSESQKNNNVLKK